jgi:hypothetical protein
MKKVTILFVLALASAITVNAGNTPVVIKTPPKPTATLQKMWVDYDVTENNEYGMRIHINFTAIDLLDTEVELGVYFQFTDDQTDFLPDKNQRYYTTNGKVAVSTKMTPPYASSKYSDIQLFMPYEELDLDAGTYQLTMNVQLLYPHGGAIAWLNLYDFEYTKYDEGRGAGPKAVKGNRTAKMHIAKTTGPRATLEKMWVDHNVTGENGAKGMTIHFKFTAYDMKDIDAYVAVFFDYNDGQGGSLKDKNDKYASKNGYVSVFKSIYPAYTAAIYDDLQVFMPYDEFDLDAGNYKLSFEALLILKDGGLISKFGWYDFDYSKPADK